jgi:16S rRNA (cytosine967-C5)-methyltransferase
VSQAFKDGWFEMQDEGSQLVGLACEAKPGDTVIDECAGAGGKSLHLAALMRNEGAIIARDNDSRRLIELKERAARAKCGIISIQYTGADKGGVERGARGGSDRGAKRGADGRADVVLVDAPCTGTGTIRRNPFLKWSVTPESVAHHAALQLELLTRAAADVKPGGRLVYATCSLLQEENDDVVEAFLRERSDFRAGPATWLVPHQQGTDGFFFAMMNRAAT